MCGLTGILACPHKRSEADIDAVRHLFAQLLVNSEHRGPHATGMAAIDSDGGFHIDKSPLPAYRYVHSPGYGQIMEMVDDRVTVLMGHTRWPTRGSHLDNRNNQPLCSDHHTLCIAHNGHVKNADKLFELLGLPRRWEVDSEVLLRIAERHLLPDGLNMEGFTHDMALVRGRVSAVIAGPQWPHKVYLLKGNQPLFVWWNRKMRMLAYASEQEILWGTIGSNRGWQDVHVPAWRLVTVTLDEKPELTSEPFSLAGGVDHGADSCHRDR